MVILGGWVFLTSEVPLQVPVAEFIRVGVESGMQQRLEFLFFLNTLQPRVK